MDVGTFISIVFGGAGVIGGISTMANLRSIRKQKHAEANKTQAEAKQLDVNLQQYQYNFLVEKLDQFQKEWVEMQEQLNAKTAEYSQQLINMRMSFTSQINEKCDEIVKLKSSITFYRGFRCYKSDCSQREQKYNKGSGQ